MPDYLPAPHRSFRAAHPAVATALDALAVASDASGPLSERDRRLVKLGIAIGRESKGAIRSNVRKARDAGLDAAELRQAAVLAVTTAGFPAAIGAMQAIDEVLVSEAGHTNDDGRA
jgi:alkylhydroperoxidase/carboxymuconolactone decarboxylase family protein YurZ